MGKVVRGEGSVSREFGIRFCAAKEGYLGDHFWGKFGKLEGGVEGVGLRVRDGGETVGGEVGVAGVSETAYNVRCAVSGEGREERNLLCYI